MKIVSLRLIFIWLSVPKFPIFCFSLFYFGWLRPSKFVFHATVGTNWTSKISSCIKHTFRVIDYIQRVTRFPIFLYRHIFCVWVVSSPTCFDFSARVVNCSRKNNVSQRISRAEFITTAWWRRIFSWKSRSVITFDVEVFKRLRWQYLSTKSGNNILMRLWNRVFGKFKHFWSFRIYIN